MPLVVTEDRHVRGFCDIGRSGSDDWPDITGQLYAIYVDPPHIGRGFGKLLMDAALRGLRQLGHARVELWVEESNDRTRRFYERAGWTAAGSKKEPFGGAEITEVRYVRDLG